MVTKKIEVIKVCNLIQLLIFIEKNQSFFSTSSENSAVERVCPQDGHLLL
jgi:hypothetical protein